MTAFNSNVQKKLETSNELLELYSFIGEVGSQPQVRGFDSTNVFVVFPQQLLARVQGPALVDHPVSSASRALFRTVDRMYI